MRCVSYNIQYGFGRDGVNDLERIMAEVEGADVIALQEVERFWPRSGNVDQAARFRERFSGHYAVYGAGVDLHARDAAPADNRRRQFGNMLLSRHPILYSRHHLLPKRGSLGPISVQRSALEITIDVNGHLLRIYSVHLTHLSSRTRLPQVRRLLEIHAHALHEGFPVQGDLSGKDWGDGVDGQPVAGDAILFGDFNFQPDSAEYLEMVGPVSDYGGRITSADGFVDAWVEAGGDPAAGATSDVHDAPARLDYCFVSAALRQRLLSCRVDRYARGSDHLPLWTELDF